MLKAILNSIDEGIHVVNKDGITIYYNKIAAEHDGLQAEEVIGKPLLDVFPSLSNQTSTMLTVIESGVPIFNQHQTYRNIKGKMIDTINTTIPIKVKGTVLGAVEIAKDYSRIKQLSNKLIDIQTRIDRRSAKAVPINDDNAHFYFEDIITKDPNMIQLIEKAKKIARSSSPIFVYGETGTGKELLVQGIHHASRRSHGPFISQNCAAIPSTLLESTLFGTTKGSFTGSENREGLFELAHGGTLFLDEVHTMPYELQSKLLRVLEDGVIRRIGSNKSVKTDVRVLVATNENPQKLLHNETLRKDLYYRLNVVSIEIPPLRKRKGDIELLISTFIDLFNQSFEKGVQTVDEKALSKLISYDWPGNVRELRHCIESAMNLVEGDVIQMNDFPREIMEIINNQNDNYLPVLTSNNGLKENLSALEEKLIKEKLLETKGNINQAAKGLRIPRQTLQYKIKKYNLM
ncbi:sigma 54-interacting transcriptional regulator [Evansella sp. AB-P1]|uniref:sigma-54 interaction domain-containing protein n=1 Tax=Evansella sp. AB-P1 TaxID=3037653 RepID=UPI0024200D2B|nr:sigma 54-interacting transcriptional regulator [Evansella sp. AB-P1]MDG5787511.1 sigma 54-interacting transcriptional regulator [Evansella sp. AB-P1]